MNSLLISDLHLTANARDEYRWALFEWLIENCPRLDVKELYILGDLTDAKDYHSARLVNRIVTKLLHVYRQAKLLGITIIRGNHDGLDPDCAYFKFLGQYPCMTYIDHPFQKPIDGQEVLFLPHTNDPLVAWRDVEMHGAEVILMHATVQGSLAENGMALDGIPPSLLATARRAKIFSGDVHVPQKIGRVEYIGAPYPVRFGDKFTGRALLSKGWRTFESIPIPSIQRAKLVIDCNNFPMVKWPPQTGETLQIGDQVKVEIILSPESFHHWQDAKAHVLEICGQMGVEVCGLELSKPDTKPLPKIAPRGAGQVRRTPAAVLADYCIANKVPKALQAQGAAILEDVK